MRLLTSEKFASAFFGEMDYFLQEKPKERVPCNIPIFV